LRLFSKNSALSVISNTKGLVMAARLE